MIMKKLSVVLMLCAVLSACASEALKSPCNEYATFCGAKTKINQG